MKFAVNNMNLPADIPNDQVWVYFYGGSNNSVTGTYNSGGHSQTILGNVFGNDSTGGGVTNAIQLSTVDTDPATGLPTFDVSSLATVGGGQVWFSYGASPISFTYGAPATTDTTANNYNNFITRWQYIEPVVSGSSSTAYGVNVDQTILQGFSIPIQVQAMSAPGVVVPTSTLPANNQYSSPTSTIIQALSTTATVANSNVYLSTTTEGGAPVTPVNGANLLTNLARAVSPANGAATAPLYHDWTAYLTALGPGGALNADGTLTTSIAAQWVGNGKSSGTADVGQYYDLSATFDASGNLTMTGNTYTDSTMTTVVINGLTVSSTFAQLNDPNGIYGNNADYSWTSVTPLNGFNINPEGSTSGAGGSGDDNILAQVIGDMVAGLSMGFPGSTVTPAGAGMTLGAMNSSDWWSYPNSAFAGAQSNPLYYDTWGGALLPLTSAYGVALQDRFGGNLLAFANGAPTALPGFVGVEGAFLQINLYPDAVPEPSTWALLGFAGIIIGWKLRRKIQA
ncbi:MAG: PEP-CTERM sorting domain-containing protein [Chthoniobacterales bacterium]